MKKWIALVVLFVLIIPCAWAAEDSANVNKVVRKLTKAWERGYQKVGPDDSFFQTFQKITGFDWATKLETLQPGDQGENVEKLQLRLIALNYLAGDADGIYGRQTSEAVSFFQSKVRLPQTGIATIDTQKALYLRTAPKSNMYLLLDYKAVSRYPDRYEGKDYGFRGEVLQIAMEEEKDGYVYTEMRVGMNGDDDVVYVTYNRPNGERRILEGDWLTVYGVSDGLCTYKAVMGNHITIPALKADKIEVE